MSDFFKKSDLTRNEAEDIVSDTLNKCDDGELYLEDSKSESILLDDNKIKNSSYSSDLGFGLRAISDEIVAYSHSNEISKNSLKQSSENLKSTLKSVKGAYDQMKVDTNLTVAKNVDDYVDKSIYLASNKKINLELREILRIKAKKNLFENEKVIDEFNDFFKKII